MDETLEGKEALELEGVLASIKTLFIEKHKKKLAEEERLAALVGKESKDNLVEVVLDRVASE